MNNRFSLNLIWIAKWLIFTSIILLLSCSSNNNSGTPGEPGTPVKITNPIRTTLTEFMTLNANTVFMNKEIVRSTFQGLINKVYKNIGDKVSVGDSLFLIRTKESSANDTLEIKIGDKLFKGNILIRARASGIFTYLNYNSGVFVSDGEELATISNPSSLRIILNVPYQYASQINNHLSCTVFFPDGNSVNAAIEKVLPTVDPSSQTQNYILKPYTSVSLPENLNVSVRIPLSIVKNVLTLPKSSVISNETLDQFWVMQLINDTTAVRIDIVKGIENDSLVQIVKPSFNLTDKIITDGSYGLPDTAKVTIAP
jgi:multidrug efflux pump subunit AcrA (membrane-fusion protein)